MVGRKSELSLEAILRQLTEEAKERWGERRAEELRGPLEQTAQNLHQIATNPPNWEAEPGFYPGLYPGPYREAPGAGGEKALYGQDQVPGGSE